jgi:hypothetical protein
MYFDSRWRQVAARRDARYRLRYACMVEDLNGHMLAGIQAPFVRADPTAVDGTLALADQDHGREIDAVTGRAYAAAAAAFGADHIQADGRGQLGGAAGSVHIVQGLLGGGSENAGGHHRGFNSSGILLGMSPWSNEPGTTKVGSFLGSTLPKYPIGQSWVGSQDNHQPGMVYSFLQIDKGGRDVASSAPYQRVSSPYQAAWDWTNAPHPATGDYRGEPYYRGPTNCPWRVNPLTASPRSLVAMFSAWRPNPFWNGNFTHAVRFVYLGLDANNQPRYQKPTNTIPLPPLPSGFAVANRNMPNPFRAPFQTRMAGTSTLVQPFAQFPVSPSARNPRERTDPYYPSPMSWGTYVVFNELGRFSDIHQEGSVAFGRGRSSAPWTSVGIGMPRPYDSRSRMVMTGFKGWIWPDNIESTWNYGSGWPNATDAYEEPGGHRVVLFGLDPFERDAGGLPNGERNFKTEEVAEYAANAYFWDTLLATTASTVVAVAAHQPSSTFPVRPTNGGPTMIPAASWGQPSLDLDIDGDGYQESCSAFRNVADLDRMFLLILGEDPDAPGRKSREALEAIIMSQTGNTNTTGAESGAYYVPRLTTLPTYNSAGTDFGPATALTTQSPYQNTNNALMINLRRTPLRRIRETLYENDATHPDDSTHFKTVAATLVRAGTAWANDPTNPTYKKWLQMRRCALRDAERLINDMRMSFFGSNPRYEDRAKGRFRPYDLDGDGWAISSAYVPVSDGFTLRVVTNASNGAFASYRFTEPTTANGWTKVVYDDTPEDPNAINSALGTTIANVNVPVLVCFKDIDPTGVVLDDNPTTGTFTDFNTYTGNPTTNAWDSASFPGTAISRVGYTRWFYPAARVTSAGSGDYADVDGLAFNYPDTYFSITGNFVLEKSRFYRIITRGEVYDEWRKATVAHSFLESVLQIDPDGDVYSRPNNIDPVSHRIIDATGMDDTNIVFQRWLQDLSGAGNDRPYGER